MRVLELDELGTCEDVWRETDWEMTGMIHRLTIFYVPFLAEVLALMYGVYVPLNGTQELGTWADLQCEHPLPQMIPLKIEPVPCFFGGNTTAAGYIQSTKCFI